MRRLPTFEEMEDKKVVRGLEYNEGEWTGCYFQPTLLCKHRREELRQQGWVLDESDNYFNGSGVHSANQVIPSQACPIITGES